MATLWKALSRFSSSVGYKGSKFQTIGWLYSLCCFNQFARGYYETYSSYRRMSVAAHWRIQSASLNFEQLEVAEQSKWRWIDFPKLPNILNYYQKFTTILFVYCAFKYIVPHALDSLLELLFPNLGILSHCLTVGRTVIHPSIDREVRILLISLNIIWRTLQCNKVYNMSFVHFLLTNPEDHKKYYQKLHLCDSDLKGFYKNHNDYLRNGEKPPDSRYSGYGRTVSYMKGRPKSNMIISSQKSRIDCENDYFFHSIMSYRVRLYDKIVYRLRPNRTPQAYATFVQLQTMLDILAAVLFVIAMTFVILLALYFLLQDKYYVIYYPNCSPELDFALAPNYTGAALSSSWTAHRLIVFPFDVLENIIIWSEGLKTFGFGVALIIVLNYDLYVYWKHLDKKIAALQRKVKDERAEFLEQLILNNNTNDNLHDGQNSGPLFSCSPLRNQTNLNFLALESQTRLINFTRVNYKLSNRFMPLDQVEILSDEKSKRLELYSEIADFFKQIKRVDGLVSDCGGLLVIAWFVVLTAYVYCTGKENTIVLPRSPLTLGSLLFLVINALGLFQLALTLYYKCSKTYPVLCSLIAHDRYKTKEGSKAMMDLFISKQACFTLFGYHQIIPTTCVSFLGWTLSGFFIVTGFLNDAKK